MLVLKNTVENDKFFATSMRVARKSAARSITDDRCSTGLFLANAEQHTPIDAGGWARNPT
jgi:hypothetical protein